ncbi:coiled-coil domain protein [Trypanosoma rangeli]|uniref:Coiled-coil domain protein n=1 Tax=Trypanosoma rangeli TaxID=5698 RepID=A0A3R7MBP9_TRYRA|nr:coiled-coil domain protein [Trypanosoma rangeli]RNF02930.1 coiled-coil domain protein [Trypanosoma rangeli]|eukprot:RNF02930.1 coiled-coil domain protein [Trypanosoma rangeli]
MPPPKNSAALRHRAHIIAFSVEEQEAALMEWRAKARRDSEKLQCLHSKIDAHKKVTETVKREGRWLAACASLQREFISSDLELGKAYASCMHLLPESLRHELAKQGEQNMQLLNSLSAGVMSVRKALQELREHNEEPSQQTVQALAEKLSVLRKELLQKKLATDVEAAQILAEDARVEGSQDTPMEALQKLMQAKMETFEGLCESSDGTLHAALMETYRTALQTAGAAAVSQTAAGKDQKSGVPFLPTELNTVSLILKTYDAEMESGTTASAVLDEVYDRVRRAVPHFTKTLARRAVDEALRQKRDRVYLRSVTLQYNKRATELLESFKKAMMAEEEIMQLRNSIKDEARVREERQYKAQKELERLREAREVKDALRRAEEEAKNMEEDEKRQQVLHAREAEFQERLGRLRVYQEQQRELQEKERAVQQALEEEAALKRAIQQDHNAKRVEERKREYAEKCRLRKKNQDEIAELNRAHQRALEAFFKGVERRLGVTCDAERVLQPTTSSQQEVPFVSFSEAAQYKLHGYTVDNFMRDPRFRLQLALFEAGLHQTPYGREVISGGYHVPVAQRASEDNPLRLEH